MKLKKTLTYTAIMALGLLPAACSMDGPLLSDAEPGMVNLVLKMEVNPGRSGAGAGLSSIPQPSGTRADFTYEKPSNIYEGVRSLRILIIRQIPETADGSAITTETVEHNEYYLFPENIENNPLWEGVKEYQYVVAGGEKKRIYLIANESSVSAEFASMLDQLKEGDTFLRSTIDNVLLTSENGHPYIDNNSSAMRFIPMSEVFEADIPARGINQDLKYSLENALFLTRELSKFSFSVNVAGSAADYGINGLNIKSIKISGKKDAGCFADEAWLIPHGLANPENPSSTAQVAGGAVYTPDKYSPSTDQLNGKAITSFSTPVDASSSLFNYTFTPEAFGIPGKKANTALSSTYTPLDYFLESPAKEWYVTLTAESNGVESTFGPVELPNLPYFARNTHAQVQFTFNGYDLEAIATVLPYTWVDLHPEFGVIVEPTGVALDRATASLAEGETLWMGANIIPEDATETTLKWSSSNESIATVNEKGMVTAVKAGEAIITVETSNEFKANCIITVTPEIKATGITLDQTSASIVQGNTLSLYAQFTPGNVTNKTLIWRSSNENVATVNEEGLVTAIRPGATRISATTSNGLSTYCDVTVTQEILATGITLNQTTATINITVNNTTGNVANNSNILLLYATLTPTNATNTKLTWTSSDETVATVENGCVTAYKNGTTIITAKTSNGRTATCRVTVTGTQATTITLDKTQATIGEGAMLYLNAKLSTGATNKSLTWSSNNEKVATVNNGFVTGISPGTATITVTTSNGRTASCAITVTNVTLNKTNVTINKGESTNLQATITPGNVTGVTTTWSSSDNLVATVSSNGVVTAQQLGNATITVTTSNAERILSTASCEITVR